MARRQRTFTEDAEEAERKLLLADEKGPGLFSEEKEAEPVDAESYSKFFVRKLLDAFSGVAWNIWRVLCFLSNESIVLSGCLFRFFRRLSARAQLCFILFASLSLFYLSPQLPLLVGKGDLGQEALEGLRLMEKASKALKKIPKRHKVLN